MKKNKIIINPGDIFGMLTVLKELNKHILPSGQKVRRIKCVCECGAETDVMLVHLVRLKQSSCGCKNKTRNGESHSYIYKAWDKMHRRCDPKYFQKHLYYEKWITVCPEWGDFKTFKNWAETNGVKKGLQLDRIDNMKGYSPSNCRFVTNVVNSNNRDNNFYITYHGNIISLSLLLRQQGKHNHYNTIRNRILRGWEHSEAVDKEIRKGKYTKNLGIHTRRI